MWRLALHTIDRAIRLVLLYRRRRQLAATLAPIATPAAIRDAQETLQ